MTATHALDRVAQGANAEQTGVRFGVSHNRLKATASKACCTTQQFITREV
jgi:hypothetical protein